jgi:hypothetical protein
VPCYRRRDGTAAPQAVIVEATKPPERGMAWSAQMERKADESC